MIKFLIITNNIRNLSKGNIFLKRSFPGLIILNSVTPQKALTFAKKEQPDAIVVDMTEPDMGGLKTIKSLSINSYTRNIPVIMMTANSISPKLFDQNIQKSMYDKSRKRLSDLEKTRIASLNLLEDLKAEIEMRKKVEVNLIEEKEKYKNLFETMHEGFAIHEIMCDPKGKPNDYRFLEINPAFQRITGLMPDKILGRRVKEVIPEIEDSWIEIYGKVALSGEPISFENYSAPLKSWFRVETFSPEKRKFATIIDDITEKKKKDDELENSRRKLKRMNLYLQAVREEERKIIARELHDELGQLLTAIKIDLTNLDSGAKADNISSRKINKIITLISQSIETVKKITFELRPHILDDLGLIPAIEWLTADFMKRTGISLNTDLDPEVQLPGHLALNVFRVVQESLTNIARHSEATIVSLTCYNRADKLIINITDNGKGIPDEKLFAPDSMGLLNMKERADESGGRLDINSIIGKGTNIELVLPIHPTAALKADK